LEAAVAPWALERVRQWPARSQGLPPPLSWRADAFSVCWFAQAAVLFVLVGTRCCLLLARVDGSTGSSPAPGVVASAIIVSLMGLLWVVGRKARSILGLGTKDLVRRG
jgi:hypothetical protein